ncbi:methyl-accepting chemotaxis protein [Aliarcobacter lanthieri]|uniref:methyl-accepting chemotaxis protein n=1 Tax=Aliarcobacter lanthieri TaxID=1355374 RepID=UPI00047B949B|nr:methyl-accepting chemotaxis protein [Aliarcobacter lanthieri]
MKLKSKIFVPVAILIAVSYIILGYFNLSNNYETRYTNIKEKEIGIASREAYIIDEFLKFRKNLIFSMSSKVMIFDKNEELEKIRTISNLSKDTGGFSSVYIGYEEDGLMTRWSGKDSSPKIDNYDSRTRPWYKDAKETLQTGFTKPYLDSSTKKLAISIYSPIINNIDKSFIGVVSSDLLLEDIVNTVLNIDLGAEGFAYLVDKDGNYLVHKNEELIGKESTIFKELKSSNQNFAEVYSNDRKVLASIASIPTSSWSLVLQIDKTKAFYPIYEDLIKFFLISLVFLIVTIIGFIYFINHTLSPLPKLQEGVINFFEYLKGNTNNLEKIIIDTKDEFNSMASRINEGISSVQQTLLSDREFLDDVQDVMSKIELGYFNQEIKVNPTTKTLIHLKDTINAGLKNLKLNFEEINDTLDGYISMNYIKKLDICSVDKNSTVEQLICKIGILRETIIDMLKENKKNGITLNNSASSLLKNVDVLNIASNTAATSLEETAAALEEIMSTVSSNTQNVMIMSQNAQNLRDSVKKGESLATKTNQSMDEINSQVSSITEAIEVIDQIAFQTNILSLNAAVEAATAGEVGKGFAVVAQEVRNLASRSAEAAKQIKELVETATNKANSGKDIANNMIEDYKILNDNITKTLDLLENVATSSKEQQLGIEQITNAINNLDIQTQKNAQTAADTHNIERETLNISSTVLTNIENKFFEEQSNKIN